MATHVGQTRCVELIIIKPFAHVYQITLDDHQIAVLSVLWIRIVLLRWPVFAINARALAMGRAGRMLIAPLSITRRIVSAMKDTREILTAVVVKSYYVSTYFQIRYNPQF